MRYVLVLLSAVFLLGCSAADLQNKLIASSVRTDIARKADSSARLVVDTVTVMKTEMVPGSVILLQKLADYDTLIAVYKAMASGDTDLANEIARSNTVVPGDTAVYQVRVNNFKKDSIKFSRLLHTRDSIAVCYGNVSTAKKDNYLSLVHIVTTSTAGKDSRTLWAYLDKDYQVVVLRNTTPAR